MSRMVGTHAVVSPLTGSFPILTAPISVNKGQNPSKSILAGGIAGGIEICITYPTEYVKTQLQLEEKVLLSRYTGPLSVVRVTVRDHGVVGLYRGLPPLLIGSIPKSAVRFLGFEEFKKRLMDDRGKLTRTQTFLAGLGAGIVEAVVVVCPMETVKVRFIHDQTQTIPKYKGFLHGIKTMVAEEGVGGIYKGLTPTILKQGSNQGIRFFVYHEIKKWMQTEKETNDNVSLKTYQSLIAGALAGAASVAGNNPIDVVKSRMQGLSAYQYRNSWDCTLQVFKTDGLYGFYKGCTPRLARVCADVAIVMTLYEQIVRVLDRIW